MIQRIAEPFAWEEPGTGWVRPSVRRRPLLSGSPLWEPLCASLADLGCLRRWRQGQSGWTRRGRRPGCPCVRVWLLSRRERRKPVPHLRGLGASPARARHAIEACGPHRLGYTVWGRQSSPPPRFGAETRALDAGSGRTLHGWGVGNPGQDPEPCNAAVPLSNNPVHRGQCFLERSTQRVAERPHSKGLHSPTRRKRLLPTPTEDGRLGASRPAPCSP